MIKKVILFFDKLEDAVRARLSHTPILYALIGGIGIVLFWKGTWELAEYFPKLWGPASILLGTLILLITGLLVSFFIGDSILLSGFKGEKKLVEKAEDEIRSEKNLLLKIEDKLETIETDLAKIEDKLN